MIGLYSWRWVCDKSSLYWNLTLFLPSLLLCLLNVSFFFFQPHTEDTCRIR